MGIIRLKEKTMGKIISFPGQSAVRNGEQIAYEYRAASDVFDQASESLGMDMKKLVFEGERLP